MEPSETTRDPNDETAAPPLRSLRGTGLVELVVGCGITFISALLVILDLFDLVSDPDPKSANWYIVSVFNLILLTVGLLIIRYKPKIGNLILLAVSVLLFFGSFEILLRTGLFDGVDNPAPVWIPRKYKAANDAIQAPHVERSKEHPFGFNDVPPSAAKAPGTKRVIVLGDSFIWGSGVDEEKRWSRMLEERLRARDPSIEVYHWGQRGWSTLDQYEFLEKAGIDYEMDLLIVGWVSNDPDVDVTPHLYLTWNEGRRFSPISKVFPNAWDFLTAYLNRFLMQHMLEGYGYDSWKNRLYYRENLVRYKVVLHNLAELLDSRDVESLVVMTPNTYLPSYREKFDLVIPLFETVGLSYLDLFPAVTERFEGRNFREMWANPADGHPSPEVNALYADEVMKYLEANGDFAPGGPLGPAVDPAPPVSEDAG